MLDCEPPEIEEPSELDKGGVSAPELEVTVLERERDAGSGRENMDCERTAWDLVSDPHHQMKQSDGSQDANRSSPSDH